MIEDPEASDSPDDNEVVSGIIVGTGANGDTTYVISMGGTATDDVPVTGPCFSHGFIGDLH